MSGYTLESFAKAFNLDIDEVRALDSKSGELQKMDEMTVLSADVIQKLLTNMKKTRKKSTLSLGSKITSGKSTLSLKKAPKTINKPQTEQLKKTEEPNKDISEPLVKIVKPVASARTKPEVIEKTDSTENQHTKKTFRDSQSGNQHEKLTEKDKRKFDAFGEDDFKKHKKVKGQSFVHQMSEQHKFEKPTKPVELEVKVPEQITVMDLAKRCSVSLPELMQILIKNAGMMVTRNTMLDRDTAEFVVTELGHKPFFEVDKDEELQAVAEIVEYSSELKARAPVVTFMGHVDHGKTTLLDYIRRTRVTEGEAGGITQHIGAYTAKAPSGGTITFLDTPGHAAFTQMRARGVRCTDIVVLVVAADDGVMPQTIEAIEHAKAAKVPIVVAVNKIDKHDGDLTRIKTELSGRGVVCESWGGEAIFQGVSGKVGTNMDALLDSILLQAEVLDLKAHHEGRAKGVVIEASLSKGRGAVATILVQSGTLELGDAILIGNEYGKVRAMHADNGQSCKSAGPSTPVEILGLSGVPTAGDVFVVMESEKRAKEVAHIRQKDQRHKKISSAGVPSLQDFLDKAKQGDLKNLAVVLKADTQGSVEAASKAIQELSNEEVKVALISGQVGAITESDVNLAIASGAIVVGFNVRTDSGVKKSGLLDKVDISYYSIIYDMIDSISSLVKGLEAPKYQDRITGNLLVKDVFRSSKFGLVAGCMVMEGVVKKGSGLKVLRDDIVLHEGEVVSLRRYRDEVNEVKSGIECGIAIKDFNDLRVGDRFEIFKKELLD